MILLLVAIKNVMLVLSWLVKCVGPREVKGIILVRSSLHLNRAVSTYEHELAGATCIDPGRRNEHCLITGTPEAKVVRAISKRWPQNLAVDTPQYSDANTILPGGRGRNELPTVAETSGKANVRQWVGMESLVRDGEITQPRPSILKPSSFDPQSRACFIPPHAFLISG